MSDPYNEDVYAPEPNGKLVQLRPAPAPLRSKADRPLLEVFTPLQISEEQARPYVVKGLIARGDHIIIMGHPGCGKSVLAPHIAYAVAQGMTVMGRRVRGGPVVYIASEDGHGMKNRVRALLKRYGDAPDFHLVTSSIDLMTDNATGRKLTELIERVQPVLIVVDTLSRSYPGRRENDIDGMDLVVRITRDLSRTCESSVVNVHHVAKDGGRTPRGGGNLGADADVTMLIEGIGREIRTVCLGKNRNGPSDDTFAFSIVIDELGFDEDGDQITAPVAVETDAKTGPKRETKLAVAPALVLRTARQLDPRFLEDIRPEPDMPVCHAARREVLRDALIAQGWFPELLSDAAGGLKATRAGLVAENNALRTLKSKNFVNFNREWVWLL